MPHKRQNYLEWEEYFMSIAFLSAQRSKDPRTQVGACIVNSQNKIIGIGYNGMPIGCDDNKMPWNRAGDKSTEDWLNSKTPYVCHAELNAVLNKNLADVTGCKIYVALFPCNMCAQIIVQSGIQEVVFYSDKYHDRPEMIASRRLLDMAGLTYRQFKPRQKKVVIEFDSIEATPDLDPTLIQAGNAETLPPSTNQHNGSPAAHEVINNNNKEVDKSACLSSKTQDIRASGGDKLLSTRVVDTWRVSGFSLVFMAAVVLCSWLLPRVILLS